MKLAHADFEHLAVEQLDTVYRFARRLARDVDGAQDLVQETYVRALRARESFDLQEFGIRPWLLRILYNLHLSRAQRESRQPMIVEDEHLESAGSRDVAVLSPGFSSFEGMDEQLVRAIENLSDEYRSVLVLWALEEMSYKEIAEALDLPLGTVMSRLHRARQKLAGQLRDYAAENRIIPPARE
jgi:RNA polymerase sigma-70 factor, ECF subfamily